MPGFPFIENKVTNGTTSCRVALTQSGEVIIWNCLLGVASAQSSICVSLRGHTVIDVHCRYTKTTSIIRLNMLKIKLNDVSNNMSTLKKLDKTGTDPRSILDNSTFSEFLRFS